MALLNNKVFDLKSTNNDFLNLSLTQYNQALQERKEAWVNSTHLPEGVKTDLRNADHVKPEKTDPAGTRLSMLAPQEARALEEHNQMLRDQLLIRSLQGPSGFQPRGRARSRGGNNSNRGRGYQGNQRFNSYQNSGARGRGRGSGRGNFRPRGRQGNQQPFSEPQSFKKQD